MNITFPFKNFLNKKKIRPEHLVMLFYFAVYCIIGLSMVFAQPFNNPPDEYNRYLIPQYILEHGTLPNGYEEEIRISGYGFSYAFQPILPYMVQGYAMRLVSFFTQSESAYLYTARLVDFAFGLATAYFVMLLSRKWFSDRRLSWVFCFLATFLPQSIFVHTYVNTDSCCLFSIAIMLYALTRCLEDRFSIPSCNLLSAGIILCALSYYNAYGYILSCILLFCTYFFSWQERRPSFSHHQFLQRGTLICALVLLGIGWWFIRSALLYDGDFLGLQARNDCAALFAQPKYHPDTRVTYQSQGISVWRMLADSDFLNLTLLSFIGIYGSMAIITSQWVYRFYKLIFGAGILFSLILPSACLRRRDGADAVGGNAFASLQNRPIYRIFLHLNLAFCILMPLILSICYSYTTDYQPQGRYILPSLLPLCFYCVRGMEKAFLLCKKPMRSDLADRLLTGLCTVVCIMTVLLLSVTVYGYAFPYYAQNPVAY